MNVQFGLRMKLPLTDLTKEQRELFKEKRINHNYGDIVAGVVEPEMGDAYLAVNTRNVYGDIKVDSSRVKLAIRLLLGDVEWDNPGFKKLSDWVDEMFLTSDEIYRDGNSPLF